MDNTIVRLNPPAADAAPEPGGGAIAVDVAPTPDPEPQRYGLQPPPLELPAEVTAARREVTERLAEVRAAADELERARAKAADMQAKFKRLAAVGSTRDVLAQAQRQRLEADQASELDAAMLTGAEARLRDAATRLRQEEERAARLYDVAFSVLARRAEEEHAAAVGALLAAKAQLVRFETRNPRPPTAAEAEVVRAFLEGAAFPGRGGGTARPAHEAIARYNPVAVAEGALREAKAVLAAALPTVTS